MMKKYIPRPFYLQKIQPFIDKEIIKVVVGQRRVGKSYLLFQIMDVIRKNKKNPNIIYINKELHEFYNIKTHHNLIDYVKKHSDQHKKNYVFIDEVQEIEYFEKALRSFQAGGGYDLYCTGSNAFLLSGELGTYLSGRYVEIEIFGLSYKEFLTFHRQVDNDEIFLKYMKYGGLPYLINLPLENGTVYEYLKNIYTTILFKDIIKRHQIRHVAFLEKLIEYLADNIGSFVSAKKISDFLKSQKSSLSPNVVLNYLSFLNSAFLLFRVQRSQIGGKKIFEINEKYYFEDLGIRHALIGYRQTDISKIMENIVFLHLKMNGYKVTVGQLGDKEIDFVAEKTGRKLYIQVAYLITNNKVKEREFGNFLKIKDHYPKIVISLDSTAGGEYMGIEHQNLREFLLNFRD